MSEDEVELSEGGQEGDEGEEEEEESEDVVSELPVSDRTTRTLDFSVGKISSSSKEVLSKQLASRMDPTKFKERFATEESQGERALNRTTRQLGQLLANRLSVQRLQGLGIMREGSGKLQAQQAALKREQTRDNLSALLGNRQTKEDLLSKGILLSEEKDEKRRLGEAKKLLNSFLPGRPGQLDLTRRNILKDESQHLESKEAKQILGNFFAVKRAPPSVKIAVNRPAGQQLVPQAVPQLPSIKSVSCGWGHTAALDVEGRVWVFGDPSDGRLGLTEYKDRSETPIINPVLQELGVVTSLSCGDHHTAAVVNGKVYTWGMGAWGRLGVGSQEDGLTPQEVPFTEPIHQVACGTYHTLALSQTGKVYGFGWNKNGRVGIGREGELTVLTPVLVMDRVPISTIAAGQDTSFAVTSSGDVYSWGSGAGGALCHGNTLDQWTPHKVEALSNITSIAAGALFAVAITSEGKLLSWGNKDSQLGRTSDTPLLPGFVNSLSDVEAVACGKQHVLAATKQGTLYTWGRGTTGILGHNSEEAESFPRQLAGVSSCKQISACWTHSAFVTAEGGLFTFGSGQHGKLGYLPPEARSPTASTSPKPQGLQSPNRLLRKASV